MNLKKLSHSLRIGNRIESSFLWIWIFNRFAHNINLPLIEYRDKNTDFQTRRLSMCFKSCDLCKELCGSKFYLRLLTQCSCLAHLVVSFRNQCKNLLKPSPPSPKAGGDRVTDNHLKELPPSWLLRKAVSVYSPSTRRKIIPSFRQWIEKIARKRGAKPQASFSVLAEWRRGESTTCLGKKTEDFSTCASLWLNR